MYYFLDTTRPFITGKPRPFIWNLCLTPPQWKEKPSWRSSSLKMAMNRKHWSSVRLHCLRLPTLSISKAIFLKLWSQGSPFASYEAYLVKVLQWYLSYWRNIAYIASNTAPTVPCLPWTSPLDFSTLVVQNVLLGDMQYY